MPQEASQLQHGKPGVGVCRVATEMQLPDTDEDYWQVWPQTEPTSLTHTESHLLLQQ